jgi:hypothetical protein
MVGTIPKLILAAEDSKTFPVVVDLRADIYVVCGKRKKLKSRQLLFH